MGVLFWGHSLKVPSTMAGRAQRKDHEAAGYILSKGRRRRRGRDRKREWGEEGEKGSAQLMFSFFFSLGPSGMVSTTFRIMGIPTAMNPIFKHPHGHAQGLFPC